MATTTKGRRPAAAKEAAGPKMVRTIAAAATALGVHQRTLKEWLSRGAPGKTGAYDPAAIAAWRESTLRPAKEAGDDWEKRRRAAQAQREELRLARERRELIAVKQATAIVAQHAAEVRAHLDQLPELAASCCKLGAKEKKILLARLKEKVRELCEGFEGAAKELAEAAGRDT